MHKELIGKTEFTFRQADSLNLLNEIYRLRYQVYCNECHFIKPEEYPQGFEQDQYDKYSLQFVIEDSLGAIGTARVILNSELGFPFEEHCKGRLKIDRNLQIQRSQLAEISRLVISKQYRKRDNDGLYYSPDFKEKPIETIPQGSGQRIRPMAFGLYREIYQESKRRGINYWCCLMEKSLWTLLTMHGFTFQSIGDEIDFYGPVRPYLASVEEVEESVGRKFPDFFKKYFLEGLEKEFWPAAFNKPVPVNCVFGIFNAFAETAGENPQKSAFNYKIGDSYQSLSYKSLFEKSVQLSNFLQHKGIVSGDRVVLFLENGPDWPVSFLAVQHLNAAAVAVDTRLGPEELSRRLTVCFPRLIICQQQNAGILAALNNAGKQIAQLLVVDSPETEAEAGTFSIAPLQPVKYPRFTDPAVLFYTSGTTATSQSLPKLVMLSHQNLISNIYSVRKLNLCREDDVFISFLPLHHPYPFMVTFLLPLLGGNSVSFPPNIGLDGVIDCIRKTDVNVVCGVPQIFLIFHRYIMNEIKKHAIPVRVLFYAAMEICWIIRKYLKVNLGKLIFYRAHEVFGKRLRFLISGGASLEKGAVLNFYKWGFTVLEGYGLTETSPVVSWNTVEHLKINSAGKPIPDVEVTILNPDIKGIGEIAVKGPNVMLGYFQAPFSTERVIREGWFVTGDTGFLDRDGFLHVIGRNDEVIVFSSGVKVNPEEIEEHYRKNSMIQEICVFASSQNGLYERQQKLMAVVMSSSTAWGEAELAKEIDALSAGLSEHKRISGFLVTKTPLPKTNLGKLKRKQIQQEYSGKIALKQKRQKPAQEAQPELDMKLADQLVRYLSKKTKRRACLEDNLESDLGLDSLGKVELLFELQKAFAIHVPDSATMDIFYAKTVRELALKIQPYLAR